jgi:hypothetical protein
MATRIYRRLSELRTDPERDITVTIFDDMGKTMALVHHPIENESVKMRVMDALRLADHQQSISPDRYELVIIDEEELWEDQWGELIDHPSRGVTMIGKPIV